MVDNNNNYNFDMDGITPQLVSHTAGSNYNVGGKGSSGSAIQKKEFILIGGGTGPQVSNHQNSEDLAMDSSMHQSFINLIYPSKTKKIMSNEATLQAQQQQQQDILMMQS